MIFVTVGTHEQQFNRLIKFIDEFKLNNKIKDEIIIQSGYSTYYPQYCKSNNLFSYDDMVKYVNEARIVITHGGPASFIMAIQNGKIPVVVPRKKIFGEHVNDHQVDFVKLVYERQRNIIPVFDIEQISDIVINYDDIISNMSSLQTSNNMQFNKEFSLIINSIFK